MTYSIVALDPNSGELGVGVQTHRPVVGAVVPWVEPGVGAVATQSQANRLFGPQALALMRRGLDAPAALRAIIAGDENPEVRQVAVIDSTGRTAVHSGDQCLPEYGSHEGDSYSTQANMMLSDGVPEAMGDAFESSGGPLVARILDALDGGQAAGGDIRGMQSAAVLVLPPDDAVNTGRSSSRSRRSGQSARRWDLRVDNDPQPLEKLRHVYDVIRAEVIANSQEAGASVEAAHEAYRQASEIAQSDEMTFWYAVRTLSKELGEHEEAAGVLEPLFERAPQWREMMHRLPANSPLKARFPR